MRILHFIPTLRIGGAERQLGNLAKAQVKHGHDVHVAHGENGPLNHEMVNGGVHVHLIEKKSNRDPRILRSVHRVITAVRPDVVQTWLPQMDVAAGLNCLTKSIPWVMSERASRDCYRITSTTDSARRAIGYLADAVVANSEEGRRMWIRAVGPERTYVIQNALDFEAILAAPQSPEGSIGFARPFVLAVGRLIESKNVELLLAVADDVCARSDANVVICGDGVRAPMLADVVQRMGRSDRIFFFGFRQDVWGLMKAADAFVSTSLHEGQPNGVLEAMACRCPLVVSDIPSHREFLDESTALIVPPTSKAEFIDAILSVLANKAEATLRAEAAFSAVSAYTPLRAAQKYDPVYASVLAAR